MKTYSVYVDGKLKSEHEDFVEAFYSAYEYSCSFNHSNDDIIISFKTTILIHRFKFDELLKVDNLALIIQT